jgi:archaellum component FlaC
LKDIHDYALEAADLVEKHAKKLEVKKHALEELKVKYDRLVHLDTLEDKINMCYAKIHWAEVNTAEQVALEEEQRVNDLSDELTSLQNDFAEASNTNHDQSEVLAKIEADILEIQAEQDKVTDDINNKQQIYSSNMRNLEVVKQQINEQDRARSDMKVRLRRVEKEVSNKLYN